MTTEQAEKFRDYAFFKGMPMANLRELGTPEYCAGYDAATRALQLLFDAIEAGDDIEIARLMRGRRLT